MRRTLSWFLVIILSIAIGAGAVVGIDALHSAKSTSSTAAVVSPSSSSSSSSGGSTATLSPPAISGAPTDVSGLFDKVKPSIVRISGTNSKNGSGGTGSGIVLDKNGNILTNNHVVSGFDKLDVTLPDDTAVTATVVGTDPGNDMAVVHADIPADKLQPATLGDSSKVKVGQPVIAIGYPFDIGETLTQGVVSAIGRTLSGNGGRPLRQLIQSDAAINPGNSGGGLFDASGNVVGITAAIENPSGERVFVGIGYTVPIDLAKRFLPDMLAGKTIQHPRIGIGLQDLTPALASQLGISQTTGVLVTTVDPSSPAGKAGLKGGTGGRGGVGDVITQIDGHDIKTFDDLANYIDTKNVGDKIDLKLVRDGKEMTVNVTLDAWQGANA